MPEINWPPSIMSLEDSGGNWDAYCEELYTCFITDFRINGMPKFEGQPLRLKCHPRCSAGREATFWHLISDGKTEADRIPNMRRCERLCWVRPMIEAIGTDQVIAFIEDRPEKAIIVTLPDFSFKIVLARRDCYFLLWTAYYLEHGHQRRKLQEQSTRCKRL